MPTYEYKCKDCGFLFEKFQKMSDEPLTECPNCKGTVKRLIGSGAGIIFKGTGFYETDYKKKDNSSSKKSTSVSANAHVEPKTETKSETKTESTTTKAAS